MAFDMSVIQLQRFHYNKTQTKCNFHSIVDFDAETILAQFFFHFVDMDHRSVSISFLLLLSDDV